MRTFSEIYQHGTVVRFISLRVSPNIVTVHSISFLINQYISAHACIPHSRAYTFSRKMAILKTRSDISSR